MMSWIAVYLYTYENSTIKSKRNFWYAWSSKTEIMELSLWIGLFFCERHWNVDYNIESLLGVFSGSRPVGLVGFLSVWSGLLDKPVCRMTSPWVHTVSLSWKFLSYFIIMGPSMTTCAIPENFGVHPYMRE